MHRIADPTTEPDIFNEGIDEALEAITDRLRFWTTKRKPGEATSVIERELTMLLDLIAVRKK